MGRVNLEIARRPAVSVTIEASIARAKLGSTRFGSARSVRAPREFRLRLSVLFCKDVYLYDTRQQPVFTAAIVAVRRTECTTWCRKIFGRRFHC